RVSFIDQNGANVITSAGLEKVADIAIDERGESVPHIHNLHNAKYEPNKEITIIYNKINPPHIELQSHFKKINISLNCNINRSNFFSIIYSAIPP
ncbi:hypothetical protein MBAV_002017, partial [Candidatus Magnetobacterium bavaricum]